MDCHSLLQRIFSIQRLNPGLLKCRQILYYLSHQEAPSPWMEVAKNTGPWGFSTCGLNPLSDRGHLCDLRSPSPVKQTHDSCLSGRLGSLLDLTSMIHTSQPSSIHAAQMPPSPRSFHNSSPNILSTLFLWHVLQPTLYKNVCFYTSHLLDLRMAHHRRLVGFVTSNWLPRPRVVQGQEGEALLPHLPTRKRRSDNYAVSQMA